MAEVIKNEKEIKVSQKALAQGGIIVLVFALGGLSGYVLGGHNFLGNGSRVTANTLRGSSTMMDRTGSTSGIGGRDNLGGRMMGGKQSLEVTAVSGNTLTVKLPSGSTSTITVGDSTVYKTTTTGTKDSVKVGSTIAITGTNNSDTATEITVQ